MHGYVRHVNSGLNKILTFSGRCESVDQIQSITKSVRHLISASKFHIIFLIHSFWNTNHQKTKKSPIKACNIYKKRTTFLIYLLSFVGPEYSRELTVVWYLKKTFFSNKLIESHYFWNSIQYPLWNWSFYSLTPIGSQIIQV